MEESGPRGRIQQHGRRSGARGPPASGGSFDNGGSVIGRESAMQPLQ